MKKIISCLLAVMMLVTFIPAVSAAGTATISTSASSTNITVGSQVTFYINFSGSDIGSYNYTLNYNTEYLEFIAVSGDGEGNGTGGKIKVTEVFDTNVSSVRTAVVFKTKKVGSTSVNVSDIVVANGVDLSSMTVSGNKSVSINIAAKPEASTDNTLKSLTTSPAGLTPAFSASVTDYTVQVDYTTTRLVVSASANDSKARVSVSGADNLNVGENTVKVVCTAESGATKTYIIKVTRKASDYAGVTATVDGVTYTVAYDVNSDYVPQGFTKGESSYGGRKMVSFTSANGQLTVVRLVNAQNVGAWYIYDAATESFAKYVEISTAPGRFVILNMPADTVLPEGFADTATDITIAGVATKAYAATAENATDFYLIYAMAPAGEKGFYIYDSAQNTLQRYFTAGSVQVFVPIVDKDCAHEPQEEPDENDESPLMRYALMAAAALLFVGGVVMLVLLLKKPSEKKEEDEE